MKTLDKFCDVFVKDGAVYVFPNVEPQPGVRLASPPVKRLALDSSPEVIGSAVMDAIAQFRTDVPFPDDFKAASLAALAGTGFNNWKAISKRARRLGVLFNGTAVTITPTAGDGRQNFADLPEKAVSCPPAPADVGAALLDRLAACK